MLRVADIDASLDWYERVLGCTVERRIESFGLYQLRAGANLIDLVPVASKAGKPGGGAPGKTRRNMEHFALKLAAFDEKKLRRYLKRRGIEAGETARRYGADGHGPSLYLTDPDGNTVELKGPPDADQRREGRRPPSIRPAGAGGPQSNGVRRHEGGRHPPSRRAGGARLRGHRDAGGRSRGRAHQAGDGGLNHFDLDVCDGISGYLSLDMPHILGVEGAGTVAETGAAVSAFRPGDRVMPFLTITSGLCRHRVCNCALGMDNICLDFEKLGVTCWGTYAEYVKVSHHNVLRIPDGVSALDAAAGQVAFATAWELVVKKAQVRQGEDVLINAAGSGVGSAAIQCARVAGARIIATAGSDEKLARARQLGADEVINYNETPAIGDAVRDLTDGRGVDVCIEMVGGSVLQQSLDALALNGRLATCGAHAGEKVEIDMIEFFRKQITMTSCHFAPKSTNHEVLRLMEQGKLRPVIGEVLPLAEMRTAHERLAARAVFGKIVLEV